MTHEASAGPERVRTAEVVAALCLATDLAADIAANSIGGLWATAFALDTPQRVSRLVLVGAPVGLARDAPLLLRLMSRPLLGQALGRLMMRNPTRDGNRKFWGQVQVAHPERLEDAFLDVDVAHTRRNLDTAAFDVDAPGWDEGRSSRHPAPILAKIPEVTGDPVAPLR